jgi:hypothetical protein
VNAWFRAIRLADQCQVDGIAYRVAGQVACLQPDGSFWQEWLLVPPGDAPDAAAAAYTTRWVAWEEDIGGLLWKPIPLPDGIVPGELDRLSTLQYAGLTWRRQERDSYQVAHVEGNVGSDSVSGERVEYSELLAGTQRLCLEWNERGLEAYHGRKYTAQELRAWFAACQVPLEARALQPVPARPRPAVATTGSEYAGAFGRARIQTKQDLIGFVIGIAIFIPVLMLDNCASDCQQRRINPTTGQVEYVCANGSVRSSRPWFGK